MTVKYSMVGYNGIATTELEQYWNQSIAGLIGRCYIPFREGVNLPEAEPGPTLIRPMPLDFPAGLTVDQWGVSYPAGLSIVVQVVAVSSPRLATIEDSWNQAWLDQLKHTLFDIGFGPESVGAFTSVVPTALPAGYTARYKRDWYSQGQAVTRRRTPTGLIDTTWIPTVYPYGHEGLSIAGPDNDPFSQSPNDGTTWYSTYDTSPGNRKVQYQLSFESRGFTTPVTYTGSIGIKLSHNADGTDPGSTADGSVSDHTASYGSGSFTHTGSGGFGSTYTTAWIDAGTINASTLGVTTNFKAHMSFAGVGGNLLTHTFGINMVIRLSPRLDVPFVFTCTRQPNVVIVGGVPT